jgi:hypothetical protein
METREQQIARKMAKISVDGMVVALSKLPEEKVAATEALVNEMVHMIRKSAVPSEKTDVKLNERLTLQRDTAKTFMEDVIATLESYDKKESIEVRN